MINHSLLGQNWVSLIVFAGVFVCSGLILAEDVETANDLSTELLWGDTHLHTSYSFDAFLKRNQSADPDTAYRWAKGLPVIHPYNRARVQINTPLDFLVVSDHAESLGVMRSVSRDTIDYSDMSIWGSIKTWVATRFIKLASENETVGTFLYGKLISKTPENPNGNPITDSANQMPTQLLGDMRLTSTQAWSEIVAAAEDHNQPGKFTSLIGWEWSSTPTGANLHRVVFTPDGADIARQFLPYGSDQSQYPEDLWAWLEATQEKTGARFVSIPHNSNISKGYMFPKISLKDKPITAEYARRRMSLEPVVEVIQVKGDSETHPALSPDDEFADFETYGFMLQQSDADTQEAPTGAYVRSALKAGLILEKEIGVNPYKFGMIGSTDSHNGLSAVEENNFWGKFAVDSIPENKTQVSIGNKSGSMGWDMAAQGLAAVWAKENTREEIYAAFKRKEVYATSGPRIRLRLFAGWGFESGAADAEDIASIGYTQGVPMGDELSSAKNGVVPQLLIRATKDPKGANLDRVQVIKGWADEQGNQFEKVINVAWSDVDTRTLDSVGRLPAVGSTVDMASASYDNTIGTEAFSIVWADENFNPKHRAFYYLRVLQIPTPRHSLYDAVALKQELPEGVMAEIQERAYSSPIWYTP